MDIAPPECISGCSIDKEEEEEEEKTFATRASKGTIAVPRGLQHYFVSLRVARLLGRVGVVCACEYSA